MSKKSIRKLIIGIFSMLAVLSMSVICYARTIELSINVTTSRVYARYNYGVIGYQLKAQTIMHQKNNTTGVSTTKVDVSVTNNNGTSVTSYVNTDADNTCISGDVTIWKSGTMIYNYSSINP